ncbi:hypothetical protein [Streptomyces sp. NPDC093589]
MEDLPERFGLWKGARDRLRMWAADGPWDKAFTAGQPHDPKETA